MGVDPEVIDAFDAFYEQSPSPESQYASMRAERQEALDRYGEKVKEFLDSDDEAVVALKTEVFRTAGMPDDKLNSELVDALMPFAVYIHENYVPLNQKHSLMPTVLENELRELLGLFTDDFGNQVLDEETVDAYVKETRYPAMGIKVPNEC